MTGRGYESYLRVFNSISHDISTCLGVQIDEKLSWDIHIDMICKKARAGIGAMRLLSLLFL